MDRRIERRAAVHAALGEPVRLAIVEDLAASDRPLGAGRPASAWRGNLLAHHLDVLERVGLIDRHVSAGDRRRRYVRLRHDAAGPRRRIGRRRGGRALFICTQNSARSQLAAALWRDRTGERAGSAGTHPADRVHPGAVAAASGPGSTSAAHGRGRSTPADVGPTSWSPCATGPTRSSTPPADWLHWSIPDPVEMGAPGHSTPRWPSSTTASPPSLRTRPDQADR